MEIWEGGRGLCVERSSGCSGERASFKSFRAQMEPTVVLILVYAAVKASYPVENTCPSAYAKFHRSSARTHPIF